MDIYEALSVQEAGYTLVPFSEEELTFLYRCLDGLYSLRLIGLVEFEIDDLQRIESFQQTLKNYGASCNASESIFFIP